MKKWMIVLFTSLLALSLVGCSQNKPKEETENNGEKVTITHVAGTVEVNKNPQRIAVLDLAALDILNSLGLGDHVIGVPKSSSVSYLKSYNEDANVAHLGSVKEVDMETLNSAEPDLILIGGRLAGEIDNLSKIAPTIQLGIDYDKGTFNSSKENALLIASLFDMEDKVNEIFEGFAARMEILKTAGAEKTAILSMVTSSSLSTLGDQSRCSMITNEIGFTNIAKDVDSTHGDGASFELLLNKNPEYLFVLDRDNAIQADGAKTAQEVLNNDIIKKTQAYLNNQIIYLTPDVWYLSEGGIQAMDTMIQDLETGILK